MRSYYERRSAVLLGIILVSVILALNTAVTGLELADDPDVFRQAWPPYFFPLVMMLGWLLHLPIGLLALGLGIGAVELVGRRRGPRRPSDSDRPDRG